ncbi:MAG: TerC family protein [Myxococcota bacterium]|nr:TerC family protein [Myxococcota bacterium]
MLIFLQAVLGFDNLLYISIESKRVPPEKQQYVRRLGIGVAIALRIILLFVVIKAIDMLQNPLFSIPFSGFLESQPHTLADGSTEGGMTVHAIIVLAGGIFIIYTAFKEITHMLSIEDVEGHTKKEQTSVGKAVFSIIIMNLVFSFDSILSAIALTHVFWVMAVAIVISGVMMMLLADQVSEFLQKNRMYEVLGLFILFIVGVMLVSEGGHLAHLKLLDYEIEPMAKSTFYFVIIILVFVDVAQSRYQKKIDLERKFGEKPPAEEPQIEPAN